MPGDGGGSFDGPGVEALRSEVAKLTQIVTRGLESMREETSQLSQRVTISSSALGKLQGGKSCCACLKGIADCPAPCMQAFATQPQGACDWGSILATGAHGVEKDVVAAERYLRAGADGGDAPSQRNLGMLLLELDRPEEAAEQLRAAASAGDEQAAETLRQLADEAARKVERARFQLGVLASQGDERAIEMLRQLENGGGL